MAYALDPSAMDSYLYNAMMRESAGNPGATTKASSAGGLYGFTNDTFLQHARPFFPAGTSDQDILAQKFNPELQTKAMKSLTNANAGILSSANIQPTPSNLYAAHFLGAGDAKDVLSAPDDKPVADYVDDDSLAANPKVFTPNMTVGQFKQWAASKMGNEGDLPSPNAQNAQGQGLPPGVPSNIFGPRTSAPGGGLGDTLMQIGGLMMSRGNPVGAQFIQTMLNNQRAQEKAADEWSTDTRNPVTAKDGTQYYPSVNKRTGEVRQIPTGVTPKEETEDDNKAKPTAGINKNYLMNTTSMRNYGDLIDDINKFEKLMVDNDLKMNVLDTGVAEFRNSMGKADENSAAIKEAQRLQNRIKFEYLKQEPGATTRQKIQQAGEIMFPAGSQYSTATYLKSIQDAKQQILNGYLGIKDSNEAMYNGYKGLSNKVTGPDGKSVDADTWHTNNLERWNKFDDEFRPQMDAYTKQKLGANTKQKPQSFFDFANQ